MKKVILIIIFIYSCSLFSQNGSATIDLKNIDYRSIESLFFKKLNDLRKQQQADILDSDPILKLAAEDQAKYQFSIGKLSHEQNVKGKETPYKRVVFYKGTHGGVGENCVQIVLQKAVKGKNDKESHTVNTLEDVAKELYIVWKNSPGHYKNMITKEYEVAGLGFYFDSNTNKLYAAQVFAQKPYKPIHTEIKNTENSWGIEELSTKDCDCVKPYESYLGIFSNYLVIEGDSVFQYFRDLSLFNKILNKPTDGIAIDIVFREQLNCLKHHNFHGSPVHDGIMLQPRFYNDLIKDNKYKKYGELRSFVTTLPKGLKGKYQLNTIIIKNKHVCRYSFPVSVVSENHNLLTLIPKWVIKEGDVKPDSFKLNIDYNIPFNRGETEVSSAKLERLKNKIENYKGYIKNINVKTFSSVEGSTEINIRLQQERAKKIKEKIQPLTNEQVNWEIESTENWEEFYKQVEGTRFAYLKAYPHEKIKELLKRKEYKDSLDYLLKKERIAKVTFSLEGKYNEELNPDVSIVAFNKAVQKGDSAQAIIIQSKMLMHLIYSRLEHFDIINQSVPAEKKFLPVITNILAASCVSKELFFDYSKSYEVARCYRLDTSYVPMKFNYCIYALKYWSEFGDTLLNPELLEKDILLCYKMKEMGDTQLVNNMLLNYYVLSAYYFYENRKYDKLSKSLQGIRSLYPKVVLSEEDALKLAKLFNLYYKFQWSIDILMPYVNNKTRNEDLLFTYVITGALYWETPAQDYYNHLDEAIKMNQNRFCEWLNDTDYQLLRRDLFKERFCNTCKIKK